jgi:hypothetical protein
MGAIGLWAVVAALAPASRFEASVGTDIGYQDFLATAAHAILGDAGLTLTIYARQPLVDDDAPYSLQPFLQRASRVSLGVSGGGSDFSVDNSPYSQTLNTAHRYIAAGSGAASFDIYLRRWIALGASFSIDGSHIDSYGGNLADDTLGLHGSLDVGLRWRDLRFDLGYRIDGNHSRGQWLSTYYGHVAASAEAALKRMLLLYVSIDVIDHGALVWGALAAYPMKRFGLFWGLGGGRGGVGSSAPVDTLNARLGFSAWGSRHIGISVAYELTWTKIEVPIFNGFDPNAQLLASESTLQHIFSFTLSSRIK